MQCIILQMAGESVILEAADVLVVTRDAAHRVEVVLSLDAVKC